MEQRSMTTNYFSELYKVDVSGHIEKKGKFSYVSWPFAVAELRKRHPEATWEVCRFNDMPFMVTPAGVFVEVAVTVNGVKLSQIHPVLNAQNKPIAEPNAFDINTSIQRALVKAIALHGLGLFIYAGEDLPEVEAVPFNLEAAQADVQAAETLEVLQAVYKRHGAIAAGAKDRDGYASLKALVSDRKAVLEGKV